MDDIEQRFADIEEFNIFVGTVIADILLPTIERGGLAASERERLAHALGRLSRVKRPGAQIAHSLLTDALNRHREAPATDEPQQPRDP